MWWPLKQASTCRSKDSKGEWDEKFHDYVIVCRILGEKIFTDEGGGRL